MNRSVALLAAWAIIGEMVKGSIESANDNKYMTIPSDGMRFYPQHSSLTVQLGAGGYKEYVFDRDGEHIVITADELFEALKSRS